MAFLFAIERVGDERMESSLQLLAGRLFHEELSFA